MKKVRLNKVICTIILLALFEKCMCMHAYASELELEPRESAVSNPYKFKISYTWTSS